MVSEINNAEKDVCQFRARSNDPPLLLFLSSVSPLPSSALSFSVASAGVNDRLASAIASFPLSSFVSMFLSVCVCVCVCVCLRLCASCLFALLLLFYFCHVSHYFRVRFPSAPSQLHWRVPVASSSGGFHRVSAPGRRQMDATSPPIRNAVSTAQ